MLPSIEKLMEEIERFGFDDKLYFEFLSEEELEVCAQYNRGEARSWSVWYALSPDGSRQSCSAQHLPQVLKAFKLDERAFSRELAAALLTQAAYADEFVRSVQHLLGEEPVRYAIRSTQDFLDGVRQLVGETFAGDSTKAANRPALKEAPTPEQAPKLSDSAAKTTEFRSKLRIIRS